jgi:hypothetical protein
MPFTSEKARVTHFSFYLFYSDKTIAVIPEYFYFGVTAISL